MKAKEVLSVPTLSPEGIAKKHGVELDMITSELIRGIEVEKEHSYDEKIAREIALDHLNELPDYYTRLDKMEDQGKDDLNLNNDIEGM